MACVCWIVWWPIITRIEFRSRFEAASTLVVGAVSSRVLATHVPVRVELAAGENPRRRGAALAPLLLGCPSPACIDLDLDGLAAAQLAYGLVLRSYLPPTRFRRDDDDPPLALPEHLVVLSAEPELAQAQFARLEAVAQGVFLARDLVWLPGNVLGPAQLAESARALESLGVTVDVLDPAAQGLNLLAAVGQGSVRPPLLVVLRWNGGAPGTKPLVLVGKGITFDSGGLSIKPALHMDEMKGDMGGAAAVLGAMRAIAGRKAAANVVGVLAIAENMPGAGALRPGDVLRSYQGLTVEVVDTDAEGRLVLADALAWACANLRPRLLLDVATLTGSVVRTLGHHHAGLYSNRDSLAKRLTALGLAEDEALWRLPLSAHCDEDLRSAIADWRNCGWGAVPDANDAARFLSHFVDPGVAWAHLDIAGTSEAAEDHLFGPKGATGFAVRLFDALAAG